MSSFFQRKRPSQSMHFVLLCLTLLLIEPVFAGNSNNNEKQTASNLQKSTDKASGKNEKLDELTLNDLNDLAILLQFIKEQSINIYEEAAREKVGLDASPEFKPVAEIPIKEIDQKNLLPARQEWLVFYLGVMEPVIRDMGKEIAEIESGSKKFLIPDSMKNSMDPLWESWKKTTKDLNHHLDELVQLFDDMPPKSSAIRDIAVEIHSDVLKLEKSRKEIFVLIQTAAKNGNKDKIFVSPE